MKKCFVLIAFSIALTVVHARQGERTNVITSEVVEAGHVSSERSIRIYRIVRREHFVAKAIKKGSYNSETNQVTVDGKTYRVYENPYYGNSNDSRGDYRYTAGDYYYFNL